MKRAAVWALLLLACGPPSRRPTATRERGAESVDEGFEVQVEAAAGGAGVESESERDDVGGRGRRGFPGRLPLDAMPVPSTPTAPMLESVLPDRREPLVWRPRELAPRPAGPVRVRLAELDLLPGGSYQPASGPCQDLIVYVREGSVQAAGTGVAPPRAPMDLHARDAVRFGAEGDGIIRNDAEQVARTLVAFVRRDGEPIAGIGGRAGGPDCTPVPRSDPRFVPNRVGHEATTQPLTALGGQLRVRILLDQDGQGARHGGLSVLEAGPSLAVPQHRHAHSAELLYVDRGSGTMQLGETRVAVRPGAAIYIPPGVLHDFRGDGTQPFRAIQIYSPSGPEQRFR